MELRVKLVREQNRASQSDLEGASRETDDQRPDT